MLRFKIDKSRAEKVASRWKFNQQRDEMKKTLFSIGVAMAASGCATQYPDLPPLEVVSVHEVAGKTKQELCGSARDWVALSFKDSNAVIQVFDAERGKLIGKGNMTIYGYAGTPFKVDFTLMADCKDGRVRAIYSEYQGNHQGTSYPLMQDSMNLLQTKADAATKKLDASLGSHLKSKSGAVDF